MPTVADFIAHNFKPICPFCENEMKAGVLSGSSDSTGHTDEYYCQTPKCKKYKIRITLEVRDPERI